jgi:hypothetical protein
MNAATRQQAIAIAAAIFAARDLATGDIRNPRTARAVEDPSTRPNSLSKSSNSNWRERVVVSLPLNLIEIDELSPAV